MPNKQCPKCKEWTVKFDRRLNRYRCMLRECSWSGDPTTPDIADSKSASMTRRWRVSERQHASLTHPSLEVFDNEMVRTVCEQTPPITRTDEANFYLIAAAPDLLESCEEMLRLAIRIREGWSPGYRIERLINRLSANIVKAKGESDQDL